MAKSTRRPQRISAFLLMFSVSASGTELQNAQVILQRLLKMPDVAGNDEIRGQIEKVASLIITHQRRVTKSARHGFNRIRIDSRAGAADTEIFRWLNNEYLQPDRAALDSGPTFNKPIDRFRNRANQVKHFATGKLVAAQQEAILRMANEIQSKSAQQVLSMLDSWNDFDVFDLDEISDGNPILTLGIHIVFVSGISNSLSVNLAQLAGFLHEIEAGYNDVPFHSRIHACDVLSAVYFFLKPHWELQQLNAMEILSALIAAACHDFRHPGTTNSFQIATESELSLIYNNRSVLESYHASEAMKILRRPEFRFCLGELTADQRLFMRTNMIEMILATDMSQHVNTFRTLEEFQNDKLSSGRLPFDCSLSKRKYLQATLHTADLSNPARPLELYLKWTENLMQEFYAQGDAEQLKGLPVSPMMNRNFTDIPKYQLSFIDFVVRPLFASLSDLSTSVLVCLEQLESNRSHWVRHILQPLPPDID